MELDRSNSCKAERQRVRRRRLPESMRNLHAWRGATLPAARSRSSSDELEFPVWGRGSGAQQHLGVRCSHRRQALHRALRSRLQWHCDDLRVQRDRGAAGWRVALVQ